MKTQKFIFALLICLLVSIQMVNAQGFVWAQGYGSTGNDVVMSQVTDTQGYHYMAGYFSGPSIEFGNFTLTNSNGEGFIPDLFVVKFDEEWNPVWAYSPDGDEDAYGSNYSPVDIDVDLSGKCYLTGSYRTNQLQIGGITLQNNGSNSSFDPFVACFNFEGQVEWALGFGGNNGDKAGCIKADPAGNFVYVAGWFYSETIDIEGLTFNNSEQQSSTSDIYMAKISANGSLIWASVAGGDNIDKVQDMAIDQNGNAWLVGTFKGHTIQFAGLLLENTNPFFDDGFIVKYNSSGDVTWTCKAGGSLDEIMTSVNVDASGNIYVAGSFMSQTLTMDDSQVSNTVTSGASSFDIFAAKLNSDLDLVWLKKAGGDGNDAAGCIYYDNEGNVFLAGGFSGEKIAVDDKEVSNSGTQGTSDIFLSKLNMYGNSEWIEAAGGIGNDGLISIFPDNLMNIYITGQFENGLMLGNIPLTSQGGQDFFVSGYSKRLNVFSGTIYLDANKNGVQDNNESGTKGIVINIGDNTYISDEAGDFSVYLEPGSYICTPQAPEFYSIDPQHSHFSFSGYGQQSSDNNFALQALIDTAKVQFTILSSPSLRKGEEFFTYYCYKNTGTDTIAEANLTLTRMEDIIYLNSFPTEDSITNDSIYWKLPNLLPFEERIIAVKQKLDTVLVNTDTTHFKNSDDLIIIILCQPPVRHCIKILLWVNCYWQDSVAIIDPVSGEIIGWDCLRLPHIDPVTGDTTMECDSIWRCDYYYVGFCWWEIHCWIILIAFDPNEIEVSPSDTEPYTPEQLAVREPLEYTIRFQNTGNASCLNAVVLDTISDNLDLTTFEMLGTSHDCNVSLSGRTLKWTFNNINLPDSTTDEPGSHGYIRFRIKPNEDLVIGDKIKSTAYIYFDYEAPVVTNTVCTVIAENLGIGENEEQEENPFINTTTKVKIAPNPFNRSARVILPESFNEDVIFRLYDMTGQLVREIRSENGNDIELDRENLVNGMYIYLVVSIDNTEIDRGKVLIN